jgi:hypothetical protein
VTNSAPAGVYFNGSVYFQSPRVGDDPPELWKWNLGAAQPPATAPQVLGMVINDGSAQRSVIGKLTVTFDRVVNLAPGAVTLVNTSGVLVEQYSFPLDSQTVDGRTVLTIPVGSLDDGRYTLTIKAGNASDASTGGVLAVDSTFHFSSLLGDLNGDGVYDRDARWVAHNSIGLRVGDAGSGAKGYRFNSCRAYSDIQGRPRDAILAAGLEL